MVSALLSVLLAFGFRVGNMWQRACLVVLCNLGSSGSPGVEGVGVGVCGL